MEYIVEFFVNGPVYEWVNDLLHLEVTKMTVAFLIASEIHSRKVKKEFGPPRDAIDHVAAGAEKRFSGFDERLKRIEDLGRL